MARRLNDDPDVVVWTLTRVELLSALARRHRAEPGAARRVDLVRRRAERIVETHPLRAAAALRIGGAVVAAEDNPDSLEFVTFDLAQAAAAEREGFHVIGPD
ncbi:MAG: hypothetical protein AUH14_00455 [Candidatus Rokubacteria bacterium 13_2_20CM_69_15_1]|nr:MAG: hypothetical protein AUH14_00455 [Candidatus Rokubacteria bacterium 13_2_20CM_69_15_1]